MHVPPPPHADGKKIFCEPKVASKESPEGTSISFSPLILIFTGPDGANFSLTNSSSNIRSKETNNKIPTTSRIDFDIEEERIIINLIYYLIQKQYFRHLQ